MNNNKKIHQKIHSWLIWQILLPLSYVPLLVIIYSSPFWHTKNGIQDIFSGGDLILLSAIIIFNFSLELAQKKTDLKKEFYQFFGVVLILLYIIVKCVFQSERNSVTCLSVICIIVTIFACITGSSRILNCETRRIIDSLQR